MVFVVGKPSVATRYILVLSQRNAACEFRNFCPKVITRKHLQNSP